MGEALGRKIELFIRIEQVSSEIYSAMGDLCPAHRQCFAHLAKVEENHASVAVMAGRYYREGKFPKDFISAPRAALNATLETASDLLSKVKSRGVTMEEALKRALLLEEATCEVYCSEFKEREDASEVIRRLQRMMFDTEAHITFLRRFIREGKYSDCP